MKKIISQFGTKFPTGTIIMAEAGKKVDLKKGKRAKRAQSSGCNSKIGLQLFYSFT